MTPTQARVCHAYINVALECVYLSRIFTHHFRAVTYTLGGQSVRACSNLSLRQRHTHTTRVEFVVLCTLLLSCDGSAAVAVTSVQPAAISMYMERAICEHRRLERANTHLIPAALPFRSFCPYTQHLRLRHLFPSARSRGGSVE